MKSWETIAAQKRQKVLGSIPQEWTIPDIKVNMSNAGFINSKEYIDTLLPGSQVKITNLSFLELSKRLSTGEYSSYEVCEAFCHRAALAHQILNCCIEIFFEKAFEQAKKLDQFFESTGRTIGPFHGIPISLKDQVNLPGIDTTIGYIANVGCAAAKKSLIAQLLEQNGAIFYVKTTVPMAMMAPDTISNLHGHTLNPININFSCGGSSGGEGALIGAGGSLLGIGTDIGGSIRIPACFQGLYALRPSHGRISYMNVSNSYLGQEVIPSVIGPLASSLKAVEVFTKIIVDAKTWEHDPKIVPLPWRDMSLVKQRKLRFAVMLWDGSVMVHPPVSRALKKVVDALTSCGHQVIEWNFKYQKEVLNLAADVFSADHGGEVKKMCELSGEPIVNCVKPLIGFDPKIAPINVEQWWKLGKLKSDLREKFYETWAETSQNTSNGEPIDAILSPVWHTTGFKKDESEYAAVNYTVPYNVLDCASVILPVTFADKSIDTVDESYVPMNEFDKKIYEYYDPETFDKMPVCVQIACREFEEEKALAISSVIDELLRA